MIDKVQEIDRFLMVSCILMFLLLESKVHVIKTTRVYISVITGQNTLGEDTPIHQYILILRI